MYDITWEYDLMEDQEVAYEQTQPSALLPARCPKFQPGDNAINMHNETGDAHRIIAAHFETAYPAQWWYQLETSRRWYPEGNLWTTDDWRKYQTQRSIYKLRWEAQAQDRLKPPKPPRWKDYVNAWMNPEYAWQVNQYRKAFVDYVDYYFGAWKPPVELYNEYMSCIGFVRGH